MIPRLLLLAGSLTLGSCATVDRFMGGEDNVTPPTELEPIAAKAALAERWSRDLGKGIEDQYLKLVPAVAGERVYAAGRGGRVSAYRLADGTPLWEVDLDVPVSGGPGTGDGLVLVGTSDAEVHALEADTGAPRWQARVSSEVLAPPVAAGGVVVVRTVDGKLAGLDAASGERLWIYDRPVPVLTLRGTSAPVVAGERVIAGFDGGLLVALSLGDGVPLWEERVAIASGRSDLERMVDIDAAPVVVGEAVYAVTYQGNMAALDIASGRTLWQREISSHAGFTVAGDRVYVTDDTSLVWALDRSSGASLWRQSKLAFRQLTAPASLGDLVAVADFEGWVHLLDAAEGTLVGRARVDGDGITATPIAAGGQLLVYGDSGRLTALAPR
jgi:outer membrane protein assembly factor BamB